jgi:hypothetical protein
MKNYAKVGNKKGRPAFRTPATFRYRAYLKVAGTKNQNTVKIKFKKHGTT